MNWGCLRFFLNFTCCCCAWVTLLWGCCIEVSKEVELRWLLERCFSTLEYVYGELFYFANSKTSSPLPYLRPQKSHFVRKQMARWWVFFFFFFVIIALWTHC